MSALTTYTAGVEWTAGDGPGTTSYTAYSRDHRVHVEGKAVIDASAEPASRGDAHRVNPEELFVAAIAQCHMLWFLHMAATDGVVVVAYTDRAVGTVRMESAASGQFVDVVLHPRVELAGAPANDELLARLHRDAQDRCLVGRSVNFPVYIRPVPST